MAFRVASADLGDLLQEALGADSSAQADRDFIVNSINRALTVLLDMGTVIEQIQKNHGNVPAKFQEAHRRLLGSAVNLLEQTWKEAAGKIKVQFPLSIFMQANAVGDGGGLSARLGVLATAGMLERVGDRAFRALPTKQVEIPNPSPLAGLGDLGIPPVVLVWIIVAVILISLTWIVSRPLLEIAAAHNKYQETIAVIAKAVYEGKITPEQATPMIGAAPKPPALPGGFFDGIQGILLAAGGILLVFVMGPPVIQAITARRGS